MKKFLLSILTLILLLPFAYSETYMVEEVVGNVTYENSNGDFKKVEVGQMLDEFMVVQTSINSSLKLTNQDKSYTIKPKYKGTIKNFILTSTKVTIKKGASLKSSNIAKDNTTTSKSVVTASSRASEAKEDYNWEE